MLGRRLLARLRLVSTLAPSALWSSADVTGRRLRLMTSAIQNKDAETSLPPVPAADWQSFPVRPISEDCDPRFLSDSVHVHLPRNAHRWMDTSCSWVFMRVATVHPRRVCYGMSRIKWGTATVLAAPQLPTIPKANVYCKIVRSWALNYKIIKCVQLSSLSSLVVILRIYRQSCIVRSVSAFLLRRISRTWMKNVPACLLVQDRKREIFVSFSFTTVVVTATVWGNCILNTRFLFSYVL